MRKWRQIDCFKYQNKKEMKLADRGGLSFYWIFKMTTHTKARTTHT